MIARFVHCKCYSRICLYHVPSLLYSTLPSPSSMFLHHSYCAISFISLTSFLLSVSLQTLFPPCSPFLFSPLPTFSSNPSIFCKLAALVRHRVSLFGKNLHDSCYALSPTLCPLSLLISPNLSTSYLFSPSSNLPLHILIMYYRFTYSLSSLFGHCLPFPELPIKCFFLFSSYSAWFSCVMQPED